MTTQTQDGNKLSSTFQGRSLADHGSGWDSLWKESFTPWDRGGPSLALNDVLAEQSDLIPASQTGAAKKTALVPGCGRGHDVLLLSAWGYDVYGLDISAESSQRARENEKATSANDMYKPREGIAEKGNVTWLTGDFFADDFLAEAEVESFDLVFDYTFFCALPPSARPLWAKRMSQLVSPNGRLICLEWPSHKPTSELGPPWGVRPELYLAHFSRPGEDISYDLDGTVTNDNATAKPSASSLKRLAHLKPSRTHQTGTFESGEAHDRVSIWSHQQ